MDWVPGSEVGLEGLLDFCDRWKFKATIFVAGRFAENYADLIRECRRRGHELGTHGWEHGGLEDDEDFRSASYDQQRKWIRLATEAVEKASGVRPVVFRAPSLWISETTLRALEDEGYRYDSSVPAKRFDCGFGRVHYLKYFRAPSDPYRLSSSHLRLPGCSSIIEMAPSAFLLPSNMATLRVLGLPVMKWMVRQISRRASRLVFYCHPYEFVHSHRQSFPRYMSKWNMEGMRPENFSLLDAFVEYVMQRGYTSTLFADSFGKARGSSHEAPLANTRLPLTKWTRRSRHHIFNAAVWPDFNSRMRGGDPMPQRLGGVFRRSLAQRTILYANTEWIGLGVHLYDCLSPYRLPCPPHAFSREYFTGIAQYPQCEDCSTGIIKTPEAKRGHQGERRGEGYWAEVGDSCLDGTSTAFHSLREPLRSPQPGLGHATHRRGLCTSSWRDLFNRVILCSTGMRSVQTASSRVRSGTCPWNEFPPYHAGNAGDIKYRPKIARSRSRKAQSLNGNCHASIS